jgi:2'-5' RNA ligase
VHLTASIQPPEEVLDHLDAALREDLGQTEQVSWQARSRWRIKLADFGSVVRADATALSERIAERIGQINRPTLRLEEVRPLPSDGDDSIWVGIGGDADLLAEIAAELPHWSREIGFVPDRRVYYAGVRIGRVTAATTVAYLEGLVTRLGGYEGPAWTSDEVVVGVEKQAGADQPPRFEVFEPAPFADGDVQHGAHSHASGSDRLTFAHQDPTSDTS